MERKRITAILLCAVMMFTVSACGAADTGGRTAYRLDFRFEGERTLVCSQKMAYVNNTGVTLDALYFHADVNAFRDADGFGDADNLNGELPEGFVPGGMDVQSAVGKL